MKKNKIIYFALLSLLSVTITSCKKDNASIGGFDENGASHALFSVSLTKQVRFSKGNLQYKASTDTWRFAENQYDYIGTDNENISSSYNGWIDLFGWGTSGWNSGAVCYQPWSTEQEYSHYYPGGNYENNLTGACAEADWGVYNAISNGGNQSGMWRTLTKDEWEYLLSKHLKRKGKWAKGTIGGTFKGLIILPDDWTKPEELNYEAGDDDGYYTNEYTLSEWEEMEEAGAIFLPAAGERCRTDVDKVGKVGDYWSTTYDMDYYVHNMWFYDYSIQVGVCARCSGAAVRLVQNAD